MFFKSLIAAACIAILAVTGVYFMDRQNRIEAERAAAERQATIEQALSEERAKAKIAECAPELHATVKAARGHILTHRSAEISASAAIGTGAIAPEAASRVAYQCATSIITAPLMAGSRCAGMAQVNVMSPS